MKAFDKYPYPENLFRHFTNEKGDLPADLNGTVAYILETLCPRDREIILMRWKEHKTVRQMSERYNISYARAGQLVKNAERRMTTGANLRYLRHGMLDEITFLAQSHVNEIKESLKRKYTDVGYQKGYDDGSLSRIRKPALLAKSYDKISISDLNLSARAYNAIMTTGIQTVDDLIKAGDSVAHIRNMGVKTLGELVMTLNDLNVDVRKVFPEICHKTNIGG